MTCRRHRSSTPPPHVAIHPDRDEEVPSTSNFVATYSSNCSTPRRVHVHVIPIHDGWTVEQAIAWLEQGLLFPDTEPVSWTEVIASDDDCDLCCVP